MGSSPNPSPAVGDPLDRLGLAAGAEGAITGTVVCAAVIAYGAGHFDSTRQLSLAIVGTLVVYWLAHLHATTLAISLVHRHHPVMALRHAVGETWHILGVSAVPVLVLLVANLAGASLRTSSWIALIATIGLLAAYSFVAGMRGGLGIGGRLASAAAGAALGVVVALLKVALH
jgi:hypothetical protein